MGLGVSDVSVAAEYWPLDKLAAMTDQEADRVISLYAKASHDGTIRDAARSYASEASESANAVPSISSTNTANGAPERQDVPSRHDLQLSADSIFASPPVARGQIFLLGSGPGSPALLTLAAHELLTKKATLILSDKLVPSEILALIPSRISLTIAKKFPGNAEGAQNELMDLALEGARRGEIVVRLKQGDPYVYGRGGEEVLFFRERGFEAVVVPGISSAFAAPLMAGIPVTQRGVSESVVVCTGVGRKGKGVKLPGYERSRTTVVLMGVARLQGVVHALTSVQGQEEHGRDGGARDGAAYPSYCPIAIIEKASSPDQRMVASTLEGIVNAMERAGEQRPPGMMIIGWSALALEGEGDVQVLDGVDELSTEELEAVDRKRIQKWLGPKGWIMREGLDPSWSTLVGGVDSASISDITAL